MADPKMEQKIFQLVLETLTRERGGASQVADLAEVDRSRVSRWHEGELPTAENRDKILALFLIRERLQHVMTPTTAAKWLTGLNALLGNRRPVDLLRKNRIAEVLAALEQTQSSSYA